MPQRLRILHEPVSELTEKDVMKLCREHGVRYAERTSPEGSLPHAECVARFSRDRLGEQPLLYAQAGGEITVGRTYEELFAGGVVKKWRVDALIDFAGSYALTFHRQSASVEFCAPSPPMCEFLWNAWMSFSKNPG